jgi:hypothetical protein
MACESAIPESAQFTSVFELEEMRYSRLSMSSDSEVATWSVVEKADPFGNQSKRFRIQVIYLNGKTRMLSMAFLDRHHLDRYVSRFHPELIGKETPAVNASSET